MRKAFLREKDFTQASHHLHTDFNALFYSYLIKKRAADMKNTLVLMRRSRKQEVKLMFSGLEWYWWLVILALLVVSVPFKVKFMKWWERRRREKKKEQDGEGRDEE